MCIQRTVIAFSICHDTFAVIFKHPEVRFQFGTGLRQSTLTFLWPFFSVHILLHEYRSSVKCNMQCLNFAMHVWISPLLRMCACLSREFEFLKKHQNIRYFNLEKCLIFVKRESLLKSPTETFQSWFVAYLFPFSINFFLYLVDKFCN